MSDDLYADLVNADPGDELGLLDADPGPAGRLAAAVYRASAHLHRDAGAGVRRQLLALDAARYGDRDLAARILAAPVEGEPAARWRVAWATGSMVDHRLRQTLTGHTREVLAVATAVVDGRPVAVAGNGDGTVRVWDPATGQQIGRGISRPHSLTARLTEASADALTLDAEFTLDRGEFGLGWNQMGVIRGLTTVATTLRFTRTAA